MTASVDEPVRTVVRHPDWCKDVAIYQINTRQFTPEGTFRAAESHLPRLVELGVGILWLMPVHPIGRERRKGALGSPYAVRDYLAVDPDLGTLDDLRHFVQEAHRYGFRVLLDWVANHTAWDNPLVREHPDWYVRDSNGDFRPTPWWDWDDVIDLDYGRPELRRYMLDALKFWVDVADVDGYRCDVAGFVPVDFWEAARAELDEIKPVFLLAEWEARDLHVRAFDMSYAWSWNEAMHRIAAGTGDVNALRVYYAWNEKSYPDDAIRMTFVSNHDKNSWEGTEFEQFGESLEAAIVLSVVGDGMPLIYNGQESGNDRRLAFFDRDPIEWREHPMREFYRNLLELKKQTTALWNGAWGATMVSVPNAAPEQVLSFVRADERARVFAAFNLSDSAVRTSFSGWLVSGSWTDHFSGREIALGDEEMNLEPWSYRVLIDRR